MGMMLHRNKVHRENMTKLNDVAPQIETQKTEETEEKPTPKKVTKKK